MFLNDHWKHNLDADLEERINPHYRPSYKTMWEDQKKNNRILIGGMLSTIVFSFVLNAGAFKRNAILVKELEEQKAQTSIGLRMSVQYADLTDDLTTELASCSAKLDTQKLSKKAQTHVKQQPVVAQKIKDTFGSEWVLATELISRESSLNPQAINPTSGACGLGQALPCSKMKCELTDITCQLNWVRSYVSGRYGSLQAAINHHNMTGWY